MLGRIPFPCAAGCVPGGGDNTCSCGKDLSAPGAFGAAAHAGLGAGRQRALYVYRVVDAFKSKAVLYGVGLSGGATVTGDSEAVEFFRAGNIAEGLFLNFSYFFRYFNFSKRGVVEKGFTSD